MLVNTECRVPIKGWCDDIDENAFEQAKNLANLPFTFKHVALMPDCHLGYGMPIGGVLATDNVIIPNAVGVDIGCGMVAVKIRGADCDNIEALKNIRRRVRETIPMGFNKHDKPQYWNGFNVAPRLPIIEQELQNAKCQLGTLGGGNHFIEIQKDDDNNMWLMLHSGSRNFGKKIADHYHHIAKNACEKYYTNIPTLDLAFLPYYSVDGQDYKVAMSYACDFAKESRSRMMVMLVDAVISEFKGSHTALEYQLDVSHNYARFETHFGQQVMVHRKGAISADVDELGIIPGSQGTPSYIVIGKGNRESFRSCSHGAGRKMGRKQAQRELSLEDEIQKLDNAGVLHGVRNIKDLDESVGAYKDIDVVMANQSDLVRVVTKLYPIVSMKG